MKNEPGYPLPEGELGEDEIVCQLVYLPDRPEYWQAFLGALHYMTTWRAWARDSEKRGKDAATNWRAAFELTIGCWRMTCLQDLQDDVAAILEVLQARDCCGESDVTGGDQYTDRVTDGVGDVPQNIIDAGYADDAADWAGFDDYKCMVSHVLVDQIEVRLATLLPWFDFGGKFLITIGIITAVATIVLASGGAVLAVGLVATTGVISGLYAALSSLVSIEDLIDNVSDHHDELACAMYNGDGDEDSLIQLNSKINELFTAPEALVLTNMNLGPTLKALYAGRYDQQDVAANLEAEGYDVESFDCTCDYPVGEYRETYTWDADDWEGWTHNTGDSLSSGNPDWAPKLRYGVPTGYIRIDMATLASQLGISNPSNRVWDFYSIQMDYLHDLAGTGQASIQTRTTGGAGWIAVNYPNSLTWTTVKKDWGEGGPRQIEYTGGINLRGIPAAGGGYTHIDNVILDFDTYLV
jgi:hypothetical protein